MSNPDEDLSDALNDALNAGSVDDLLIEAEAVIWEIERRLKLAETDARRLGAARDRVQAVLRRVK